MEIYVNCFTCKLDLVVFPKLTTQTFRSFLVTVMRRLVVEMN